VHSERREKKEGRREIAVVFSFFSLLPSFLNRQVDCQPIENKKRLLATPLERFSANSPSDPVGEVFCLLTGPQIFTHVAQKINIDASI
jgi:hypothetical protein